MDELPADNTTAAASDPVSSAEAAPSLEPAAPPASTSVLSDAPTSDALDPPEPLPKPSNEEGAASSSFEAPQFSAQTESILNRINNNAANAAATGTPGWEAAKEQVMKDMQTSDKFATSTAPDETGEAQKGGNAASEVTHGIPAGSESALKMEGDSIQVTPSSTGRGRGGGRPRGRGRGGGRGGKRKREDRSEDDSDDSEVYSPVVTTTKSGRSVQKPTSFVPPPQSPTTNKRKRPYRRNPESAVCKVCLRGTSPASNMIVFCDGCNTPYHRLCHHPPIEQAVVDEIDKEWYCKQCEKERVMPVPESEITHFVSAEGAPVEQRQRYFASLPPGMLVTLLTKATTLKPDLPLFPPDFQARTGSGTAIAATAQAQVPANGHSHPRIPPQTTAMAPTQAARQQAPGPGVHTMAGASHASTNFLNQSQDQGYGPDVHPANYPRPGHGLMRTLPPEQEDLQWLVEDDDRYGVFSHMYQVDSQAANAGMNGGMGGQGQ